MINFGYFPLVMTLISLPKMNVTIALEQWKRKCKTMDTQSGKSCLYIVQFADHLVTSAKEDLGSMAQKLKSVKWANNETIATRKIYKYLDPNFNKRGSDNTEITIVALRNSEVNGGGHLSARS